jgi:predicted P-loop ATPase
MQALKADEIRRATQQAEKDGKVALGDYNLLVEELLKPRLNIRAQKIEINGEILSDAAFDNLHVTLASRYAFRFRKADLQSSLAYMAGKSTYDPVAEELNGYAAEEKTALTREEWADIARLCLGVEGEYEGEVLRKWLIGCVARVFDPGCKVDQALILKSGQGGRKSSFFTEMGGQWFTDSLGDLSNEKDDRLIISRYWICEWGEIDRVFAGANRSEKVKQVVTARNDVFRAPYGRTPESHPRRSVLVGTTNRNDFLNDHTGNRRFPVIEVKRTNTEWITANRHRIWARAVAEYRAGEQWWFSPEQEAEITRKALAYAPENEAIDQVHEFLKIHPGRWFNARELAELALQRDPERIDQKELNRLSRDLQRLTAFGAEVERRFHIAPNPKHGKGSKNCFRLPPERDNA